MTKIRERNYGQLVDVCSLVTAVPAIAAASTIMNHIGPYEFQMMAKQCENKRKI